MTDMNDVLELGLTAAIALSVLASASDGKDPALSGTESRARSFIDRMVTALGPRQLARRPRESLEDGSGP